VTTVTANISYPVSDLSDRQFLTFPYNVPPSLRMLTLWLTNIFSKSDRLYQQNMADFTSLWWCTKGEPFMVQSWLFVAHQNCFRDTPRGSRQGKDLLFQTSVRSRK